LRIGARVVAEGRSSGESHEHAEPEQEGHSEPFRALYRDVDPQEDAEGCDEEEPSPPIRHVAAEIRPEREQARRDGDQAHGLPEQAPALVTGELLRECRAVRFHDQLLSVHDYEERPALLDDVRRELGHLNAAQPLEEMNFSLRFH
jgi:hypothetical protein